MHPSWYVIQALCEVIFVCFQESPKTCAVGTHEEGQGQVPFTSLHSYQLQFLCIGGKGVDALLFKHLAHGTWILSKCCATLLQYVNTIVELFQVVCGIHVTLLEARIEVVSCQVDC